MDGESQIVGDGAHLDRERAFADQIARAVRDDVQAEQLARLAVDDDLREAFGVVDRQRAAERRERKLADLDVGVALGLGLVFGQARRRDLRIGEYDRGDRAHVHRGLVTCDDLGDDLALVRGLVREHHAADEIADRVDARYVGAQVIVGEHVAALVGRDAGDIEAEVLAVRATADRQ